VKTAELQKRGLTAADFPRMIRLAENVYAYEAVHVGGLITTNNLIVVTPDGVLVADGQGTPAQTERLVADIRTLTTAPIRYAVIASHHGDHTGGIAAFPAGVTFLAHPTSARSVKVPTEQVTDRRVVTLGGREIQILFLGRSHTGGDLVVYLPAEKILFMSETYLHRMFPSMAGGYPSEWIEAIRRAEQMDVNVYVPGHGFVDDPRTLKEELSTFRRAVETVRAEGRRLKAAGVPADQAAAQAQLGEFAGWSVRDAMALPALRRVYAEEDGQLK
jgi:glyoxylase-like metal-dependent hydrolase (beta-lactamase superfamily II)